jgi:hypothetical protein
MGGCVTVAADDGQTWQGDAELGSDNVDDSLFCMAVPKEGNSKLFSVSGEGGELLSAKRGFVDCPAVGWNVVVHGRES